MTTPATRVNDTPLSQNHGNNGNSGNTAHVGAGQSTSRLFPLPMPNGNRNGNTTLRNGNKPPHGSPLFPFGAAPVPVSVPVPGTDSDRPDLRLFPLFPLFPLFGTHPSMASTTLPNIPKEKFVPDSAATETVTVPKSVLGPVLTAHLHAYSRDKNALSPEVADAVRTVFNLTNTPAVDEDTETVQLDAETAWTLAFHCLAEDVYGLDETDEATYQHPAVAGRHALMKLVADQAPETDARLNTTAEAAIR